MKHFVYEIWNPFTIECIYVGKDSSIRLRRFREHLLEVRNLEKGKRVNHLKVGTIKRIQDMGASPICFVVGQFENESEASTEEKRLIAYYGRKNLGTGTLTNLTDGGEGASGRIISNETRQKMSQSKKGIPLSPERREQFRLSRMAIKAKRGPKEGTPLTEEHKKKLSEARTGRTFRPLSEETKAKLSQSLIGKNLGKKRSEESRAKMRAAALSRKVTY